MVVIHNHNGVITYPEPGILECKIKWALGSITTNKASGGDGISVELFQILKDLDLEKAEKPESSCQHLLYHQKKQENSRKTPTSALLIMPKPLAMWITTNCGKFFKKWEYQST